MGKKTSTPATPARAKQIIDRTWQALLILPIVAGAASLIYTTCKMGWQIAWHSGLWGMLAVTCGAGLVLAGCSRRFGHPKPPVWRVGVTMPAVWLGILGVVALSTAPLAPWYWLALVAWGVAAMIFLPRNQPSPQLVQQIRKPRTSRQHG